MEIKQTCEKYFNKLFTDEIINQLKDYSNSYFSEKYCFDQMINYTKGTLCYEYSKSVFIGEKIKKYLAICIIMGFIKFPDKQLYWSTMSLYNNIIPDIIHRARFRLLNADLKLENENWNMDLDKNEKSFLKIKYFLNIIEEKFINP